MREEILQFRQAKSSHMWRWRMSSRKILQGIEWPLIHSLTQGSRNMEAEGDDPTDIALVKTKAAACNIQRPTAAEVRTVGCLPASFITNSEASIKSCCCITTQIFSGRPCYSISIVEQFDTKFYLKLTGLINNNM